MPNPWFRLYSEFEDDPKVQSMSEAMQRRLLMLFCGKCKGRKFEERFVTFHWRVTVSELAETKAVFLENGFIDEKWNLLNWNKRQFTSDSSTDRTRRYRERQRTSHFVTNEKCDGADTDTEQKQKKKEKQKPSRAKPESDERHTEFREKLGAYWEWAKLGKMPWDGSEAKKMALTLKANPTMTLEEFGICLKNRHNSEGMNLSSRPRDWLERITDFRAGPLDRFNKLKNGASNGNHKNGKPTASQRATAELSAALLNFGAQGAPDSQSGRPAGPDAQSADGFPAAPGLGAKIIEVRPKNAAGSIRPGGGDVGSMANGVKDHSPDW